MMRGIAFRLLRPAAVAAGLGSLIQSIPQASAETLQQALRRTYQNNPQLNADRARQRATDETVPQALAGYRPQISAGFEAGPNYQYARPGNGPSFVQPLTLNLNVDMNLFDGGRTSNSVRSAESAVLAGRATLRGVEQTVLLMAVTAYLDVLRDQAIRDLVANNITALSETLRIARVRYEKGDARRTDMAQAEARLARGKADLAVAVANLAASQATYRQVVGAQPADLAFPRPADGLMPASLTLAVRTALEGHPAVRAAVHAVDGAQTDVRVIAGELAPSLRVTGTLQRVFGQSRDDDPAALPVNIGPQLTVPIYEGGEVYARVRQAKETVAQRRAELEATRDDVRSDMRSAWGTFESARASVPANEKAVEAAEVALAGVTRESLEGARTILDVLNSQQELLAARSNLVSARRDLVVASYGALAAMGVLTHKKLDLATRRYRPETHYEQVRDLGETARTPDGR